MSCNDGMPFFPANFMLQNPHEDDQPQPPSSLNYLPKDFHGVGSFLGKRSSTVFSGNTNNMEGCCELETANINGGEEDLSDEGSQLGEKKRRLSMEQVKALEKNFELANKLEPERKMQLARALGLQPRQIAIWFQNRRARWKTKQLEKDYDCLKRQFDAIKTENDNLHAQNQKLQAEILVLKNSEPTESVNLNKETEGSCSDRSDNSSDNTRLEISRTAPAIHSPLAISGLQPPATTGRSFFQQSPPAATNYTVQFLENSTSNHQSIGKEENNISNMFCGIDEQTGMWPWLEHQHFN